MRSKGKSKRRFMRQRGGVTYDEINCSNYKNYNVKNISHKERGMIIAAANVCGDAAYANLVAENYNTYVYNTAAR